MEEKNTSQQPSARQKKKSSKGKYLSHKRRLPVGLILLIVAFVGIACLVIAYVKKPANDPDKAPNTTKTPTASTTVTTPTETAPTETEPTESTPSEEQVRQMADALLQEAEFVAAGYDYTKAIEMLKDYPYYDQVPELAEAVARYTQLDSQLVSYPNMFEVTHVFFHSLIVDPKLAFDNEYSNGGYNQYMTTIDEFVAMMEEMYNRGYVLVSPYDVAYEVTDTQGTRFVYGDIRLPEGKKPFIMSQDDLNYYGYMIGSADGTNGIPAYADTTGDGFACRIVIGEDGYPTCEYMDAQGNITYGDYDLVPVLERFIQEHPDFSYHGARAVLGMTGYEGVFGYRTNPNYIPAMGEEAFQKEVEAATAVAQCLRDHGWILASHSYGHPAYGNISSDRVERDSDKWETTVQPIIGDCDIILYPHGSDIAGIEKYTFNNAKFSALYEDGYRYFFNVDGSMYWNQLGANYYRGGRRNLDGYRMYYNPGMLDDLFDVEKVFDPARPTPVPPI